MADDTFEVHEKMFEERLKEMREYNYQTFEELIKSANTSITAVENTY